MDVMEFDAASRTGVDDIREIIDSSQYAPILGRFKIYIIDEVHMLSKSAFNALLKTLEEPPQHVKFIFATTELYKVPETVLSRCMTFQLKPVSPNSIAKHLQIIAQKEGYSLDQDASEVIAEESEGSVRDALSIVEQSMMIVSNSKTITSDIVFEMLGRSTNREIENLLHLILSSDSRSALKIVEDLTSKGADPFILYKNIQNCLYKMIVESTNSSENQKNCQSIQNLLYLWQILLKQTENMKNAHNPIQVLSAAVVILSLTASFQNIGDLFIKEEESPEKQILNKVESKFEGITISEIE
jgi:DNA polymerase-3 subunit gamma/tau